MGVDANVGSEAAGQLLKGRIVIASQVPPLSGATVHVFLEDVSRADGESVVLAEAVVRDIRHGSSSGEEVGQAGKSDDGATTIQFELNISSATTIDARSDYVVRVWVDSDGDGIEGPGDLYSDESYRVLTRGAGRDVTITLRQR